MSVNPDEGMQLLTQRLAANRAVASVGRDGSTASTIPDSGGDELDGQAPGLELGAMFGMFARATRALEQANASMRNARSTGWDHIHPIEISPGSQTARVVPNGSPAGTSFFYSEPDLWGPADTWAWRINGWTLVLGAGATSFSIWYDSSGDPTNLIFTSSVSGRWEPDRFFLMPGRNIAFSSVGGPLIVCKGIAEEMSVGFLPHYMAGSVARFV